MKQQKLQNWNEFNPEEWKPSTEEEYFALYTYNKARVRFEYNRESRQYEGLVFQFINHPIDRSDSRWFLNIYNQILKQLVDWDVVPERVSWVYEPNYYTSTDTFFRYLHEVVDPKPCMLYYTCTDDENCFVDSKYRIINMHGEITLSWRQDIYNDNTKPINIWNKTLELAKKRIVGPFEVRLSTPDEDAQQDEDAKAWD